MRIVGPRDGDYLIRARPLHPGGAGFYAISFALHPWNNIDAPRWLRKP